MAGQSRSSHEYLLLQVWCTLLTVSMVVMAAMLISIKTQSGQVGVSTLKPDDSSPTAGPFQEAMQSAGESLSYIQLIQSQDGGSWEESPVCRSCSLRLLNDSILCGEDGLYWIYALVSFRKQPGSRLARSVVVRRNGGQYRSEKTLVEGKFSNATEGSVWVAKMVRLKQGDQVSLRLTAPVLKDNTYWGAYLLR